ncbi:uncharacterized protein LOC126376119 isoform X2 [Pectinophora gossypiella]|nr:uncharacterized protein LOC126376119 isoform X2 [Pectinophora gossypiella]XP_049879248.1 uncharacterized protein LOC126376119 isoform X2 [Pectinophora gossypiella]
MSPIQDQLRLKAASARREMDDEEVGKMVEINRESTEQQLPVFKVSQTKVQSTATLKSKLEDTLSRAEDLIEKLQLQISAVEKREKTLKEAIVNGRAGVTSVTVSTLGQPQRTYLVRDGAWTMCNGMVQYPTTVQAPTANLFTELFASPRCIGQEMMSKQDPCAFNSVIKYETIPERRKLDYTEEDIFCLRPAFNKSLERFLSVPKRIIKDTCKDGLVRSLADNTQQCGVRMLSEYTFYPQRSAAAATLPLEYCTEKDGSCKLIVAWHVTNVTVENFEFLRNELAFKKYFIQSGGPYIDQAL